MFLSYFIEQHQFSLCASPVIQSRKGSLLLDCISVMSTVSGGTITGLEKSHLLDIDNYIRN